MPIRAWWQETEHGEVRKDLAVDEESRRIPAEEKDISPGPMCFISELVGGPGKIDLAKYREVTVGNLDETRCHPQTQLCRKILVLLSLISCILFHG